jgi:Ca-activated chloride channel homolog
MFRFESPIFFILLFIPIFLYFQKGKVGSAIKISSLNIFGKHEEPKRYIALRWLSFITFLLFVLCLARPQYGTKQKKVNDSGRDLVVVVDTSGSMKALDFKIDGENTDRLTVVKNVLKNFVKKRVGDRISIIAFGDYPITLSPLTLDTSSLGDTVDEMKIGMAGESTAIGSALGLAIKRIKDIKAKDKIVILMTDGRSNSGDVSPDQMADVAKELGIKIYTIGIGASDGKAPFLVNGFFGKRVVYQNLDLDDKTLIEISKMTNGKYFNALNSDSLSGIYDDIDRLEKRESEMYSHVEYRDYYPELILCILFLVLLDMFLRVSIIRVFP